MLFRRPSQRDVCFCTRGPSNLSQVVGPTAGVSKDEVATAGSAFGSLGLNLGRDRPLPLSYAQQGRPKCLRHVGPRLEGQLLGVLDLLVPPIEDDRATGNHSHGGLSGGHCIVRSGEGFHTLVAHLASMTAAGGEEVDAGALLGTVGDTGSLKGAYLYFEIRENGKPTDPRAWLVP